MYSIILVEDEKSIRENLHKGILWERYGFRIVAEAANGENALEKIEKLQPDVLLTDIRMPFMDGLELSHIVHQLYPKIKIVILSGYMEFGYAQEAISLGVEEYLVKPITPIKIVRTFVNLKKKMDEERQKSENYDAMMRDLATMEGKLENTTTTKKVEVKDLIEEGNREAMLWHFLRYGSEKEVIQFTEKYVNSCNQNLLDSLLYCSYFFVQTLVTCMKAVETLGGNPSEVFGEMTNLDEYVSKVNSSEVAKTEIQRILSRVMEFRNQIVGNASDMIRKARGIIQQRFSDQELGIGEVATAVGVSPNHFSFIFKQKTGKGFSRYLTELRIEKAMELLRNTDLTNSEISDMVGYSNQNYFSAVFHKTVGMTAKEYRSQENQKYKP